MTNNPTISV